MKKRRKKGQTGIQKSEYPVELAESIYALAAE